MATPRKSCLANLPPEFGDLGELQETYFVPWSVTRAYLSLPVLFLLFTLALCCCTFQGPQAAPQGTIPIFAMLFLGTAGVCLLILYNRKSRLFLFQHGAAMRSWYVSESIRWRDVRFFWRGGNSIRFTMNDNRQLRWFVESFNDAEPFLDTVEERINEYLGPVLHARFLADERIEFGDFQITKKKLYYRGEELSWDDIVEIDIPVKETAEGDGASLSLFPDTMRVTLMSKGHYCDAIIADIPNFSHFHRFLEIKMNENLMNELRDIIQDDVGKRGLRTDPDRNLVNACPDDFRLACESIAAQANPVVAVVTGFFIPTANPGAGETDGPLGALFLARALEPLGIRTVLATDEFCVRALEAGRAECGVQTAIVTLPTPDLAKTMSAADYWKYFSQFAGVEITHLLSIERVGPSHVIDAVPPEHRDRCHTMRGRDITDLMSPAHLLFAAAERDSKITTIGIGDGGNEIGMGKIPWEIIDRNIPGGGLVACRIATRHLIVCGVSNWGAYALAAGIAALRGAPFDPALFDPARELAILRVMVEKGGLVDGVLAQPVPTVDGLAWEQYADVLVRIGKAMQWGDAAA